MNVQRRGRRLTSSSVDSCGRSYPEGVSATAGCTTARSTGRALPSARHSRRNCEATLSRAVTASADMSTFILTFLQSLNVSKILGARSERLQGDQSPARNGPKTSRLPRDPCSRLPYFDDFGRYQQHIERQHYAGLSINLGHASYLDCPA